MHIYTVEYATAYNDCILTKSLDALGVVRTTLFSDFASRTSFVAKLSRICGDRIAKATITRECASCACECTPWEHVWALRYWTHFAWFKWCHFPILRAMLWLWLSDWEYAPIISCRGWPQAAAFHVERDGTLNRQFSLRRRVRRSFGDLIVFLFMIRASVDLYPVANPITNYVEANN